MMRYLIVIIMTSLPCHHFVDQVLPSKVGGESGEGVFAGTTLAKATTVCLYSGLTMTRVSSFAQRHSVPLEALSKA